MKLKAVSGIMLTLLLIGMLSMAFNIQLVESSVVPLKIGIVADIHYSDKAGTGLGIPFVAENWTKEAIEEWEEWGADFAIQLGDISGGRKETPEHNLELLTYAYNFWVSDKIPLYNVLGNHEIDKVNKSQVLALWRLPENPPVAYYSFDFGAFHFIVLDNQDYECSNGQQALWCQDHFRIWDEQKNWLIQDLQQSHKPTFVFVHVPLSGMFYPKDQSGSGYNRIINAPEIWNILESDGDVIACFEGHYHNWRAQCWDAYHWQQENGTVHYFGMTCLINKYTAHSVGFLSLKWGKLTWDVISYNFTRHYEFEFNRNHLPVGGIYIPVNKLQLLAPYIGLTILLAVAVTTVVYVKKRRALVEEGE